MDPIHGDSSSKHTYDEQGHPTLGNKPEIEKVTPSSSSSSSGGESFEEDFIQLDAAELDKLFRQSTEIAIDKLASQSKTKNGKVTGTNDLGTNDNLDTFGPNHASLLQVMERSDVPHPNGIPSSMFTRTMSTALDWSIVSNESLFSIQLGDSGDLGSLMGRPIEPTNFPVDPYSPGAANAAAMQGALRVNAEKVGSKDRHPGGDMHHSAITSDCFDSIMASFRSSTFPVLKDRRSASAKGGPVNQPWRWEPAQKSPPQTKTPKASPACKWLSCFTGSFFS